MERRVGVEEIVESEGRDKQESCTMARKLSLICSYLPHDSTAFVIHFPIHT